MNAFDQFKSVLGQPPQGYTQGLLAEIRRLGGDPDLVAFSAEGRIVVDSSGRRFDPNPPKPSPEAFAKLVEVVTASFDKSVNEAHAINRLPGGVAMLVDALGRFPSHDEIRFAEHYTLALIGKFKGRSG